MKTEVFRVHGRVQGVGFRYFVYQKALSFGINGFVKNEAGGTVLVHAQSDSNSSMEIFADAVQQGPSFGRVTKVDRLTKEDNTYTDFKITY